MPPRAGVCFILLATLIGRPAMGASAAPSPVPPPLQHVLASSPALKGQHIGIYALRLSDGAVLAAVDPDEPLIPASTVKILTAACALERLGPDFRIRTPMLADSPPDERGVIRGALYVRGARDPDLRAEDLWALVADLRAAGVTRIEGDVILDDSLFEPPGRPAGWPPPTKLPSPYDSPQGALTLAWNSIELLLFPGPRSGDLARCETAPINDLARVVGVVTTARRTAVDYALDAAPGRPAAIRVSGTVARRGGPAAEWVHLGDPALAFGSALERLFAAAGVALGGGVRRGPTPNGAAILVEHESPPLARILAPIVKNSSNFGAEMLTRLLAATDGETPATTDGGVRRIVACARRWGASLNGAHIADGSGYSRSNRLSARALVETLRTAYGNAAWGADFRASLSRAGEDGSLRRRLPEFTGRLQGKTGSLDGVAALAGFLESRRGAAFAFAILLNQGRDAARVQPASVDTILRALAEAGDMQ